MIITDIYKSLIHWIINKIIAVVLFIMKWHMVYTLKNSVDTTDDFDDL